MISISLKTIHEDLINLQKDMQFIKHIIVEEFKLSEEDKKDIDLAIKDEKKGRLLSKKQVFD